VKLCPQPTVAIGGIDIANVSRLRPTGVSGIAVVGAIFGSENPEKSARALRAEIDNW
jgi:thiamine monophosphate synthase